MNVSESKQDLKKYLVDAGLPFDKLTARTVDFTDLARARPVFVTVHGAEKWTREQWVTFANVRLQRRGRGYVVETSHGCPFNMDEVAK